MYVRVAGSRRSARRRPTKGVETNWPFADVYFLTEKNITTARRRDRGAARPGTAAGRVRSTSPCASGSRKIASSSRRRSCWRSPFTVPDMNKGLTTSSVILAKALDPAPEQLTGQQQLEQPFTISGYRVVPVVRRAHPAVGRAHVRVFHLQ